LKLQQDVEVSGPNVAFLQGGGEMGALIRRHNWAQNPLGTPDQWPQTLRIVLSILLNSKFPMFLFWGPELICFYNDAFRPSLGNHGKHPALGKTGQEVWEEIWPDIKPWIDQVLIQKEAVWQEDQLLPFYRNGRIEEIYWTFSYSPVMDESNQPCGVFVTCTETTKQVHSIQKFMASDQRFQNLVQQATVGIIILSGAEMRVEVVNEAYGRLIDRTPAELIHQPLFSIIPETEAAFKPLLTNVYTTGEPVYLYSHPYFVFVKNEKKEGYLDIVYQPYKETDGTITGVMALCYEVTEQVLSRKKVEESEQHVRSFVESAPFPIGVYVGKEMRILLANHAMLQAWGNGNVIGKLYYDVLPELGQQDLFLQLDAVYRTGIPFNARNQRIEFIVNGKPQIYYFNYSFTPLYNGDGKVYGVMNTAADVTDLNIAHQRIEESEKNLRNIILQAPVAMCILRGPEHVVEIANDRMFELWGKAPGELLHLPIFTGLHEARSQGFEELLHKVYTTGQTAAAYSLPVTLPRNGTVETVYINFVYEAFREGDGTVSGVMVVAYDVTAQVVATKKIEESEARFRLMADAMPQFIWTADAAGHLNYFNQAVYDFSGLSEEDIEDNGWLVIVHPDEREENKKRWLHSVNTGEDFLFQHRFKNKNGDYRWQLSRAVPQRDEQGNIQLWIGTSTDIHDQKLFEEELNRQVKERTLALENKNKELERSNANLQEFAYAASHDLKEPIRKIHFFANRLKQDHAAVLNHDGIRSLERLELASERMTTLVDDLLEYSQVSRGIDLFEQVDLNEKIKLVLNDLEMAVQDKGAILNIGPLPTVKGHRRQLQQLFQNLIGNAIKYSPAGIAPQISISSKIIDGAEAGIKLEEDAAQKKFHLIQIADNGIGFDEKDAERIFQVFTRLHGNAEYKGTGVGLAIARKVVENHNGFIYAHSRPGAGATFYIGLPVITD
jgi:PAS domain S-box-containing protein